MSGQQQITAVAFLHQDGKLFMAKRAKSKSFLPGAWELPGGGIDYGEQLEEGLKREFQEEFGVAIEVREPFFAFTYVRDDKPVHAVEVVYFAQLEEGEEIQLNPNDHSEYRWLAAEDDPGELKNPTDDEVAAIKRGFELLAEKNEKGS